MQKGVKIAVTLVIVVALIAGGAYAVLTSLPPGNPCAGIKTGTNSTVSGAALAHPASSVADITNPALPHAQERAASTAGAQPTADHGRPGSVNGVIPVVAAENFWGSLVSQLGGNNTTVLSIVTDPNADPHEYEANTSDAIAVSNADLVIVNGVGYDDWAVQLIASDNHPGQVVLNVGDLNGVSVTGGIVSGNPHMWYNPRYVNATVAAMYNDLVSIQPSSIKYFQANYAALNSSLASLYGRATEIKNEFAGTEVASTESIFVYLANFTGLDLVSPPAFMEAIAEGNDPPTQSVVTFQCQLESGNVKLLIYNEQTVTPITSQMKSIAAQSNVTIVGVTETIQPPGVNFQTWMDAEYLQIQNGLNADALGQ
jgi:zinc/manganese transport system substrate-binding protein